MASLEWPGFKAFQAKIAQLGDPDFSPLMQQWVDTIIEGNRRGVLSGKDGNDRPMPALKYRGAARPKPAKNRQAALFGVTVHPSQVGPQASGLHGNLSSAEYKELTGPRLAPRGERSRVITNLHGAYGRDPGRGHSWYAEAAWFDVVSVRGFAFLPAHFAGVPSHNLPRYDLRPIRPADRALMGRQLAAYLKQLLKGF